MFQPIQHFPSTGPSQGTPIQKPIVQRVAKGASEQAIPGLGERTSSVSLPRELDGHQIEEVQLGVTQHSSLPSLSDSPDSLEYSASNTNSDASAPHPLSSRSSTPDHAELGEVWRDVLSAPNTPIPSPRPTPDHTILVSESINESSESQHASLELDNSFSSSEHDDFLNNAINSVNPYERSQRNHHPALDNTNVVLFNLFKFSTQEQEQLLASDVVAHTDFNTETYHCQFAFYQMIDVHPGLIAAHVFNPDNGIHFIPRCKKVTNIQFQENSNTADYTIKGPKLMGRRLYNYELSIKNKLHQLPDNAGFEVSSTMDDNKSSLLAAYQTSLTARHCLGKKSEQKSLVSYQGNITLQSTPGYLVKNALGKEQLNKGLHTGLTEVFTDLMDLVQGKPTDKTTELMHKAHACLS